jgi:hypothetical protein
MLDGIICKTFKFGSVEFSIKVSIFFQNVINIYI